MTKGVQLIRADTFEHLPTMPAASVDCVVTSPPYWGIKDYNGKGNLYGNEKTLDEYRANTRTWLRAVHRIVKDTGSAWVVIGFKRDDRRLINLPALAAEDAQAESFVLRQMIVWDKKGHTAPNGPTNRERDTHEMVLHLTKKESGYCYDISAARAPYKNARQATAKSQHRKVYKWVAQGIMTYAQSLKAHAEIDRRTKAGENNRIRGPSDRPTHPNSVKGGPETRRRLKRDGFCFDNWHEDGAVGGNVWRIGHGGVKGLNHPCAFPVQLAWECIRRTCPRNGVVLDPFMGSGSTAVAAMRLGRRVIGIEFMREHFETAKRRVKEGK